VEEIRKAQRERDDGTEKDQLGSRKMAQEFNAQLHQGESKCADEHEFNSLSDHPD